MKAGEWIRHASTWERMPNDRRKKKGQKGTTVSDLIRAEVIREDGKQIICEDVDGYQCPTVETRPDFPAHLRWHYPIYRLPIDECVPIPIDHDARQLKDERKKPKP